MQLTINTNNYFYREWKVSEPRAVIVIAHGLGEHSGRYEHVAEYFNEQHYSVYAMDHRGHGQSSGAKGHVNSFSDYHIDLNVFIEKIRSENPDKKIHLLGHSMGGMIVTGYCLRYSNVDSVIITAPPYGVPGAANRIQLKIGAFFGKFFPNTSLSNKIDASTLCHSQKVVDDYVADPLVHDMISLAWGTAYLKEQKYISNNLGNMKIPTLLIVPQSDVVTDPVVSVVWFDKLQQDNKNLICYPDAYHEILNEEIDGAKALNEISTWLNTI